jgi:hypothetical protein
MDGRCVVHVVALLAVLSNVVCVISPLMTSGRLTLGAARVLRAIPAYLGAASRWVSVSGQALNTSPPEGSAPKETVKLLLGADKPPPLYIAPPVIFNRREQPPPRSPEAGSRDRPPGAPLQINSIKLLRRVLNMQEKQSSACVLLVTISIQALPHSCMRCGPCRALSITLKRYRFSNWRFHLR